MSKRGRVFIRRACKHLIWASRLDRVGRRKGLVGTPVAKIAAVKRAENYIALLKTPVEQDWPKELLSTVIALRKTAEDCKMSASGRVIALGRLMLVEGYQVEQHWTPDAVDQHLCSVLGRTYAERATKPDSVKMQDKRMYNRRQALLEVRVCFLEDLRDGIFRGKTLEEIATCLRLKDGSPAEVSEKENLLETHKDLLADALKAMGSDR